MMSIDNNPTAIRVVGGFMAACGLFIVAVIANVIYWITDAIASKGKPGATTFWNASPEDTNLIFSLLALVIAFGAAAMITGGWQIVTGRRNRRLIWITLGLGGVLFFISQVARFVL